MSRVLVTGGAGFIGSHLVDGLVARGDEVTVVDNLSTGDRTNVNPEARFVEADVADVDELRRGFDGEPVDAVLHVAGQASISKSFTDPRSDLDVNVVGTLNVLGLCSETNVPRLVYASSMTAYGEPSVLPVEESAPCLPVSNYGVTKLAGERYVHVAGGRTDIDLAVTSLRMFNVYGERQSLTNPYQGVLAIFIGNVLRNEPITIHSDGSQTRDFIYVADVVDAWLRVLDDHGTADAVFNVGSGRETSINELADAVLASFGHSRENWEVRTEPAQTGDQRRSLASIDSIADAVGWRPRVPLADGMTRTVSWAWGNTL
jgi:UDP-glucose 4-epimerase